MVDPADAGFVFHFLFIIILAHFQLLGVPGGLHRPAHIGGQVDAAEAGENGSGADGVDDDDPVRHKVDDRKYGDDGGEHQCVHDEPHTVCEGVGGIAQVFFEEQPGAGPEKKSCQQCDGVDGSA